MLTAFKSLLGSLGLFYSALKGKILMMTVMKRRRSLVLVAGMLFQIAQGQGPSATLAFQASSLRLTRSMSRNEVVTLTYPAGVKHHHDSKMPSTIRCPTRPALHASTLPNITPPSASPLQTWGYMVLLAFQFGAQPILTTSFTPKTIVRSTIVLAQEVVKFAAATAFLMLGGEWSSALRGWNTSTWMLVAGIPAALYVIQNYCALIAYQNLSPVTFNVLNQTKTLSAALCCFIVMGRMQSKLQIVSLFILLLSALVIEKMVPLPSLLKQRDTQDTEILDSSKENTNTAATTEAHQDDSRRLHLLSGVLPVLMASFLSGLAGALSQRSLMDHGRNSYLFTMELSAASSILLILSLLLNSPDGKKIRSKGFFSGWTLKTAIPVVTNALGGILVGLVTKYAGSVRKGFALIFGLLLSGILQTKYTAKSDDDSRLSTEQVLGGALAALSLWMHARFPHVGATNK